MAIVVDSSSEESTDMTVDCRILPVNHSIEHHSGNTSAGIERVLGLSWTLNRILVNGCRQPFPGKAERPRVSTPRFDREGLAPWTSWPGARFRNRLHVSAENHFTATRCTGDMFRLLSEKILPDSEFEI